MTLSNQIKMIIAAMMIVANSHTFASQAKSAVELSSKMATPVMLAEKQQTAFLQVLLKANQFNDGFQRSAINVAIVLDQSSSMSGDKIARAKEAAILAVSKLAPNDIVSIVTYSTGVNVLVPATKAKNKNRIYQAINKIYSRGNTALYAGTYAGGQEVRKFLDEQRVNRVVLLSDGMANVGPSSSAELGSLGKAFAKDGISVSTIGLGLGYNEDLMTQLAHYSDGNHEFVENSADLARVFDKEFGEASSVVAQDVQIEIICEEGVVPLRVIGRDANISGNQVNTRINQLYSQQENYVVVEVSLPATKVGKQLPVAKVKLNYNDLYLDKRVASTAETKVRFSNSEQEVQQNINKVVYEAASIQVANESNEKAIVLRDQGKVEEAEAVLLQSSRQLDIAAQKVASPKLKKEAEAMASDAEEFKDDNRWSFKRKQIKEKSYKYSKQQQ